MANKRSSGGGRNKDLFRTEVSSLLADLGQLAEELEARPPPSQGPEPDRAPVSAVAGPPVEVVETAPEAEVVEAQAGPGWDAETTSEPEMVSAESEATWESAPPDPELAAQSDRADMGARSAPEAGEILVELEDLPSFSPSYLPPFPPLQPVGEAGSSASVGEAELDEPASPGSALEPAAREWEPSQPSPFEWEPSLSTAQQWEPSQVTDPGVELSQPVEAESEATLPDATAEERAAPTGEEAASQPISVAGQDARTEAAAQPAGGSDGGPGWQVRRPLTMTPIGTPGQPAEPEPAAVEAGGTPALGGQPREAVPSRSADIVSPAPGSPSGLGARGIEPANASVAEPEWGLPPQLSPDAEGVSDWGNGGQRPGVPLRPGGLPPLVSTRPWSLAAAMQPLSPLGPPARPAGATVVEGAGPPPTPPRTTITLPFATLPAALIALLIVIVVLIVLDLHH